MMTEIPSLNQRSDYKLIYDTFMKARDEYFDICHEYGQWLLSIGEINERVADGYPYTKPNINWDYYKTKTSMIEAAKKYYSEGVKLLEGFESEKVLYEWLQTEDGMRTMAEKDAELLALENSIPSVYNDFAIEISNRLNLGEGFEVTCDSFKRILISHTKCYSHVVIEYDNYKDDISFRNCHTTFSLSDVDKEFYIMLGNLLSDDEACAFLKDAIVRINKTAKDIQTQICTLDKFIDEHIVGMCMRDKHIR